MTQPLSGREERKPHINVAQSIQVSNLATELETSDLGPGDLAYQRICSELSLFKVTQLTVLMPSIIP